MVVTLSMFSHFIPGSKVSLMDDHSLPASTVFPLQPVDKLLPLANLKCQADDPTLQMPKETQ